MLCYVRACRRSLRSSRARRSAARCGQLHFGRLIRDFTDKKGVVEAALISQFWGEAQTLSEDDAVVAAYLQEWFRKYPGRGIPEVIDAVLVLRVSGPGRIWLWSPNGEYDSFSHQCQ